LPGLTVISRVFRAFAYRDFRLMWFGACTSSIGTLMQTFAQAWLVLDITKSPFMLGLDSFLGSIPIVLFSLVGGVLADRTERQKLLLGSQFVQMACAFLLAGLFAAGMREVWPILTLSFIVGTAQSFGGPAYSALIPTLVKTEDLPNAIALNSSIFNAARAVGPAIAGFAIALVGAGWCFFLNGLSFVAVIVALLMMRIEPREIKPSTDSPLRSFVQGFRFAMSDLPVRSTLLLLSTLSLFGLQYAVFMPIYAQDILKGDARTLGLLMSSAGVGAVIGALQFAARTHYRGLARWIAGTSTTCAICLIIFSQAKNFWLCAAVLFVVGFAATSQMAATNTLIQNRVPDELRSRVMAVYATMFMGVQPIGALIAGGAAKHIGQQNTLTVFGSLVLAGSLIFIARVVMRLGKTQTVEAD